MFEEHVTFFEKMQEKLTYYANRTRVGQHFSGCTRDSNVNLDDRPDPCEQFDEEVRRLKSLILKYKQLVGRLRA